MKTEITQSGGGRLLSIDVLRGITIAGMILVNNPGSWQYNYAPLRHAAWDGLTPTDLVFPFFMFIMGISTYISLRKFNFGFTKPTFYKILKRTVVIFLIGLGLSWFGLTCRTYYQLGEELSFGTRLFEAMTNFGNLRILGVMQRLALSYGIAALIAIGIKYKYIPYIITVTLVGYFLLLLLGNGFEKSEESVLSIVDREVLGINHMYNKIVDPEGVLSTIPSVCHVLIGFCCGKMLMEAKDNQLRIQKLFIVGTILTFSGFLFSYACPIIKGIWSPSFVLVTCGLASLLLALLVWIIDMKGYKRWGVFFESFGVNPLFIYVFAEVFSGVLGYIRFPYGEGYISAKGFIYDVVLQPIFGNSFGSLIYSLIFIFFIWIVGNILYRKRIYIKI